MLDQTPTTIIAIVTTAAPPVYGITYQGEIFEASDPNAVAPHVGDRVLADYLPSSRQWLIVAIVQ